jgi:hypothetical protein
MLLAVRTQGGGGKHMAWHVSVIATVLSECCKRCAHFFKCISLGNYEVLAYTSATTSLHLRCVDRSSQEVHLAWPSLNPTCTAYLQGSTHRRQHPILRHCVCPKPYVFEAMEWFISVRVHVTAISPIRNLGKAVLPNKPWSLPLAPALQERSLYTLFENITYYAIHKNARWSTTKVRHTCSKLSSIYVQTLVQALCYCPSLFYFPLLSYKQRFFLYKVNAKLKRPLIPKKVCPLISLRPIFATNI